MTSTRRSPGIPSFCELVPAVSLADTRIAFTTGRASHTAAAPHLRCSALEAVELMNVGVDYSKTTHLSAGAAHILGIFMVALLFQGSAA
jgi:hypothetical protein